MAIDHMEDARDYVEQHDITFIHGLPYKFDEGKHCKVAISQEDIDYDMRKKYPWANDAFIKTCVNSVISEIKKGHHEAIITNDYVVFRNGIYCLKTNQFIDGFPEEKSHQSYSYVDCDYDPKVDSKLAKKALSTWLDDDKDAIKLFFQMIGICMLADPTRFRSFFMLVGKRHSGKSTMLRLITAIFGESNVSALPLDTFGAGEFDYSQLVGKRINISGDIADDVTIGSKIASNIRLVVSGDLVPINVKYYNPFASKLPIVILGAATALPSFSDRSGAILDRLKVIPVEHVFVGKEDIPAFEGILMKDKTVPIYIAARAIDALVELMDTMKFALPKKSEMLLSQFNANNNPSLIYLESVTKEFLTDRTAGTQKEQCL